MKNKRLIVLLLILAALATAVAAAAQAESPPAPAWQTEARQLHDFFRDWYRGDIADTDENYARLADVLADDFQLITSGGFAVDRELMLQMMRGEHGTKPDIEMRTDNYRLRVEEGDLILFTYQEHGEAGGLAKSTLISVLMRRNPAAPNGVEWVHLHEVALPAGLDRK